LNVQVPILFKDLVDTFNVPLSEVAQENVMTVAGTILVGCAHISSRRKLTFADGAARLGASAFQELRNVLFGSIAQSAIRKIARETFFHLNRLDWSWHVARHTGSVSRAIDRGTK
jgi:ABC transporter ATM